MTSIYWNCLLGDELDKYHQEMKHHNSYASTDVSNDENNVKNNLTSSPNIDTGSYEF